MIVRAFVFVNRKDAHLFSKDRHLFKKDGGLSSEISRDCCKRSGVFRFLKVGISPFIRFILHGYVEG